MKILKKIPNLFIAAIVLKQYEKMYNTKINSETLKIFLKFPISFEQILAILKRKIQGGGILQTTANFIKSLN